MVEKLSVCGWAGAGTWQHASSQSTYQNRVRISSIKWAVLLNRKIQFCRHNVLYSMSNQK